MITWSRSNYGDSHTAYLNRELRLTVSYITQSQGYTGPIMYRVKVFGADLSKKVNSVEEGKALAIEVAKKWLKEALAKLEGGE